MSFDAETLAAAIAAHGPVMRIVIVSSAGSVPRGAGTSMLVWQTGQSGTIGGGALEFEAAARARASFGSGDRLDKVPLGPNLGQCCGGAVTLLTELWDAARLATVSGDFVARPVPGDASPEMPLKLQGRLRQARSGARPFACDLVQGWVAEPLARPTREIWIYGAGHVGRALVDVLAPLPEVALTWVDTGSDRFPGQTPARILPTATPAAATALAPDHAEHLILTYSHAMDLAICHHLLTRDFAFAGLIGSATKWARFRSRLTRLGHTSSQISRITCPIGDPALGKHPQAIAVGVAASLLTRAWGTTNMQPEAAQHVSGGKLT
jgi:xanthine dehydrogenase accessory factor